ncbi:MAG: nitronate monooxygenase, partial [Chloroflexi bacterium]|nr:nitronate monooxygenase [Chloroflexota bacterium]
MWNTRVTEILGIQYPIIEGGMAVAGNGELAAAVSNAGGLGVVSSNPGGLSAAQRIENVRDHIGRTKSLTDKPFGVNFPIFILADDADAYGDMVIEEGVTVVACSGGSPKGFTRKFKDAGLTVLHVVASVRQALSAQEAGVDIVVAEGFEAGGVNSPDEVTTMVLTPAVAAALDVPVVAAGGIGDARGFMAAMALGAEGVQMGSAFVHAAVLDQHRSVGHRYAGGMRRQLQRPPQVLSSAGPLLVLGCLLGGFFQYPEILRGRHVGTSRERQYGQAVDLLEQCRRFRRIRAPRRSGFEIAAQHQDQAIQLGVAGIRAQSAQHHPQRPDRITAGRQTQTLETRRTSPDDRGDLPLDLSLQQRVRRRLHDPPEHGVRP